MMENINLERSMEKDSLLGQMVLFIKENFLKIILKAMVLINGKMVDFIKVNGCKIKEKAKVYFNGRMEENMMEILKMI